MLVIGSYLFGWFWYSFLSLMMMCLIFWCEMLMVKLLSMVVLKCVCEGLFVDVMVLCWCVWC